MNIKRGIWTLFLMPGFLWGGEGYVRLVRPTEFRVLSEDVLLQGTVELPSVRRVKIAVEPFLAPLPVDPRVLDCPVNGRGFQGQVRLFPGLNLVTVSSMGGAGESRYVFFLPASINHGADDWGTSGTVVWTEPRELRLSSRVLTASGLAARPGTRTIDVVILTSAHLAAMGLGGYSEARRTTFERLPVREARFTTSLTLTEGENILFARPGPSPTGRADTAFRTVFYEPTNKKLFLDEPLVTGGKIQLRGRASSGPVNLSLSALVRAHPEEMARRETLWQGPVDLRKNGEFQRELVLKDVIKTNTIVGFPRVEARAGADRVIRILLGASSAR